MRYSITYLRVDNCKFAVFIGNEIHNALRKYLKKYYLLCYIGAQVCNTDMYFAKKTAPVSLPLIFRQTFIISDIKAHWQTRKKLKLVIRNNRA